MFGFLKAMVRSDGETTPQLACPLAHLVGPSKLCVENSRLAFYAGFDEGNAERVLHLDAEKLHSVCCYGKVQLSSDAMQLLLEKGVNVALLSAGGREFLGRLVSEHGQKPLDRVLQCYTMASRDYRKELARDFVHAKLRSQIGAARHFQRHGNAYASASLQRLKPLETQVASAKDVEQLRGLEGQGSAIWFELLGKLIRPPFVFKLRNRRPPKDAVNALLSLGYTLLLDRVSVRLSAMGYDVSLGCLHEFRSGRPSLACDHVEPLRLLAVDRWAIRILNEGRLSPSDFETPSPMEGVRLKRAVFGTVIATWESHCREVRVSDVLDRQLFDFRNRMRELRPSLPTVLRDFERGEGWADW